MIILYQSITDPISSRHRGLMKTFGERVLTIQLAPDTDGSWRQSQALLEAAARGDAGHFPVALPGLLPLGRFYSISRINRWWALRSLIRKLRAVSHRKIVVVLQLPHLIPTIRGLGADLVAYEVRDDYIAQQRTPAMAARVESSQRRLLDRAGLVFALSEPLAERLRAQRPDVRRVQQGVDTSVFDLAPTADPSRMELRSRPRLGVVGNLNARVDWQLLCDLARRRPDWQIVAAGPVVTDDAKTRKEVDELLRLDNVQLMPAVPEAALVSYIHGFDVGMVPYRVNRLTDCVNPLKAYQYLACGKPVVATRLPGLVDLEGWVRIAGDVDSFVDQVERSLAEPASQATARRAAVQRFDWRQIADSQIEAFTNRLGERLPEVRTPTERPMAVVYQGVMTDGSDRNLGLLAGYARHVLTVHVLPDTLARSSPKRTTAGPLDSLDRAILDGEPRLVSLAMPSRYPFGRWRPIAQRNRWAALSAISRRLRRAGYQTVVVTQHPHLLPGLRGLPADLTVYEVQDDHVALRPGNRVVARGHRILVEESDLVLATAETIAADLRVVRSGVERISNGVDYERFVEARAERAEKRLSEIPHPRIGLLGNLNERVDWELCRSICERRPDWHLVLVGPLYLAEETSRAGLERIQALPNGHYLDRVAPENVAAQMKTFDVGLIPYVESRATRAINPLKAYQYLACGLPVVSSALPALEELSDVVILVSGEDRAHAFVEAIGTALLARDEESRQKRIDRAAQFDWSEMARRQLDIFRRYLRS